MDERKDMAGMLDLMILPGFCVKDNKICALNAAAKSLFLTEGMPIDDLLLTGSAEYAAFISGCLYLTVSIGGASASFMPLSSKSSRRAHSSGASPASICPP